ncbi:MAG: hypothetical protein KatS3mg035_1101 [Bacteroidia bacterium]|nr:MAG: hypothetical protein KatS3mg035_1101 [Bacteroidia bacterium]
MGTIIDDLIIEQTLSASNMTATTLYVGNNNIDGDNSSFSSFSATTLTAGTIYSAGTNLYNIFSQTDTVTHVQPGSNIETGGTANSPIVNLVSSPSVNNITLSGNADINGVLNVTGLTTVGPLTATTTISGTTLFLFKNGVAPTTPISGGTLFVLDKAGRSMFAQTCTNNLKYSFQPSLHGNKIAYWNPPGNAATIPGVFGMPNLRANGTVTTRSVSTTNLLTRTKRLALVSSSATGSFAGYRAPSRQYTIGDGSGLGGFMYVIRFGVSDARTANTRTFIGLRDTTAAPTNVEPSTLTNCIGVGNGAANNNFFIYYGGSVAQTPIDLGANFPCNTNSQDLYEFVLFASPNKNNEVGYQVIRLNTGHVASGVLTGTPGVALPSSTTLLAQNDFRTNNTSTGTVSLDYVFIYIETQY